MKQNFNRVMSWVGLSEGGYVNHPDDPGGATDRGITQRTFDDWNQTHGYPVRPVRGISKQTAERILAEQYFAPVWFDRLPSGLDYAMADYAVNSGPARAVKEMQSILGVTVDGVMGVQTLSAIKAHDAVDLILNLCRARMRFLRTLSHWPTFEDGWKKRVMGKEEGAQADDIGVIDRAVLLAGQIENIPAPTVKWDGPVGEASGRAPEPTKQETGGPTALVGGGVASVGVAGLSAVGALHPAVQALLIAGMLVAGAALFVLWRRGKVNRVVL